MMRLFEVAEGREVQITSNTIRWTDDGIEEMVARDITWRGITTNHYFHHEEEGVRRRLIINPSIKFHDGRGIWHRDCEVFIVG